MFFPCTTPGGSLGAPIAAKTFLAYQQFAAAHFEMFQRVNPQPVFLSSGSDPSTADTLRYCSCTLLLLQMAPLSSTAVVTIEGTGDVTEDAVGREASLRGFGLHLFFMAMRHRLMRGVSVSPFQLSAATGSTSVLMVLPLMLLLPTLCCLLGCLLAR